MQLESEFQQFKAYSQGNGQLRGLAVRAFACEAGRLGLILS